MIDYKSPKEERSASATRRNTLRVANKCICGPLVGYVGKTGIVHGDPKEGGRCQRCIDARKASETAADVFVDQLKQVGAA